MLHEEGHAWHETFFSLVAARLQVESFDCFIRRFLVQHSFAIGDMF